MSAMSGIPVAFDRRMRRSRRTVQAGQGMGLDIEPQPHFLRHGLSPVAASAAGRWGAMMSLTSRTPAPMTRGALTGSSGREERASHPESARVDLPQGSWRSTSLAIAGCGTSRLSG